MINILSFLFKMDIMKNMQTTDVSCNFMWVVVVPKEEDLEKVRKIFESFPIHEVKIL